MSGRIFRSLIILCVLIMLSACLGHDTGEDTFNDAERAFGRGEYHQAEKLYQNYVQQQPKGNKRWEAWQRLLVITRDISNDAPTAIELLETIYLEFKTDPKKAFATHIQQIELYTVVGDLEHALTTIDATLNIPGLSTSQRWNLLFTQGTLFLRLHHYALARASFTAAMDHVSDAESRSKTLYATGRTLIYMREYDQARQILQQTFAEAVPGPTWARIGFALAEIAEHEHNYEEGVRILKKIRDRYPNPKALDIRLQSLQRQMQLKP